MRASTLAVRSLTHFWRTNVAVVLGVGTAVSVLAGALVLGDSVRASLRDLVLNRLGRTGSVVSSAQFFPERLAADLSRGEPFTACPLVAFEGLVTHESSGRRALGVQVYGVDDRFWTFHGVTAPALPAMSVALGEELGSRPGDSILLRVEKPSVIPLESLHARKEDVGRTLRFTARETLGPAALGEFSLRAQQGPVRAIFVPLGRLARDLDQAGKVNTILIAGETAAPPLEKLLRERFTLDDLGIRLRTLDPGRLVSLETASDIMSDSLAAAALSTAVHLGLRAEPVYAYLANTIRDGSREIPYSMVVADDDFFPPDHRSGILLNTWAAQDLGARLGDDVSLDYYIWKGDGQLHTESAHFPLTGILPIAGAAADRNLMPDYPGITGSNSLRDWDPPFPIDLARVRPRDDDYWKRYRTTPKAFLPLAEGQRLWASRFGRLTSIRLHGPSGDFAQELRAALDPAALGLTVYPARAQALAASSGSTDFGEYFVYFSFFLVAAALLLAGLFFRLSVEQRLREIGMLRVMGFRASMIAKLFLLEGLLLSLAGSLIGLAGAGGYAALMVLGLRTRWLGAVGTGLIRLHVTPAPLLWGCAGGLIAALGCLVWTLRGLRSVTPRGLLAPGRAVSGRSGRIALALAALGIALLAAAKWIGAAGSFFGGGALLLAAALFAGRAWLNRRGGAPLHGIAALGFRNAAWRPGRSILCIALIASSTFLIVAVDAFRLEGRATDDPKSGTGGFRLMAESLLPVIHDPNSPSGRDALNLNPSTLAGATIDLFRVRPGDDASCLNLYEPRDPRVLGARHSFLAAGRFTFQDSLAQTPAEKNNPWLLLEKPLSGDAIPAIADANSITYVLHRNLGDEITIGSPGHNVRLRLVAALEDSIFQGELMISEANFLRAFPDQPGFRFFLIGAPPSKAPEISAMLESALSDYGLDVTTTADRLAAYHRVENTYISTFQTLGALGLVLGTIGLAAVLARNVLERRRELALLQAVGYRRAHLNRMILAENAFLLVGGLFVGASCALLAVAPAIVARGGHIAAGSMSLWLALILGVGAAAVYLAAAVMTRLQLLPALRAE